MAKKNGWAKLQKAVRGRGTGWTMNAQGWGDDKKRWGTLFGGGVQRLKARIENNTRAALSKLASGGDLDIRNAQSWNKETHPNGPGPSQLVKRIDFDKDGEHLDVTYRDGFRARYDFDDENKVMQFAKADSKGRWALKHLWLLPYEQV